VNCPATERYPAKPGAHTFIVATRRPWRLCWRKIHVLRCWECDLRIPEPVITINDWERSPRGH
jgi:hypothetical protein